MPPAPGCKGKNLKFLVVFAEKLPQLNKGVVTSNTNLFTISATLKAF